MLDLAADATSNVLMIAPQRSKRTQAISTE